MWMASQCWLFKFTPRKLFTKVFRSNKKPPSLDEGFKNFENIRGSPQRRFTSVFDLEDSRWVPLPQFKVSEYKLGILPLKLSGVPLFTKQDQKTLLAVTNAAVEPVAHCSDCRGDRKPPISLIFLLIPRNPHLKIHKIT